ncbi:hypothetical protein BH11PSE4_BH11PSE4_09830 [soil metagenome]
MFWSSKSAILAISILLAPVGAVAQTAGGSAAGSSGAGASAGSAGPPGTNSAGTAQSTGTTGSSGLGTGNTATMDRPPVTGNSAVDAQDRAVDRKIKSICKGC